MNTIITIIHNKNIAIYFSFGSLECDVKSIISDVDVDVDIGIDIGIGFGVNIGLISILLYNNKYDK